MDRLFRSSLRIRDKWDEVHGAETYGNITIKKAIKSCKEFYKPLGKTVAAEDFNELVLVLIELKPESNPRYKHWDLGKGRLFADVFKDIKSNANSQSPSEDIARLAGIRFANISEPSRGLLLNAAQVKNMTGNDTLNARFLYENSFDFKPQFKLYVNTNYLPVITDMTVFTSNRVLIIPFDRHFEEWEQDKTLRLSSKSRRHRVLFLIGSLTDMTFSWMRGSNHHNP